MINDLRKTYEASQFVQLEDP